MAVGLPGVYGEREADAMLLFSPRRRSEREEAARIYAAVLTAARRPALYLDFGVPDTLDGRFEMIALHLFALLNRLMHDPGDDPELARRISESFVDDMDAAFREMGVSDTAVPKRMKTLYRSFAGRITAYARALGEGDDALAAAVARNVFPDGDEGGLSRARSLATYLTAAVAALRDADLAAIRAGAVTFPDLDMRARQEANG
jgi:cytochrome b pre-mRNA-processing protein 3